MQNEKKPLFNRTSTWGIIAIVFVIGLWFGSIKLIPLFLQTSELSACKKLGDYGQFGDMFGAVNALFSGLAFAGVIIAIILQKEELKLQREELEQTRNEFKRQTTEFEEQNKNLAVQRFENTFFNMLERVTTIINSMNYYEVSLGSAGGFSGKILEIPLTQKIVEHNGRNAISYFRQELNPLLSQITEINKLSEIIRDFFHCKPYQANDHMGHYFRTIYSTLKLIDLNKNLNFVEKKTYTNILRAQLSNDELFLLFCNCVYRDDFIPFKLLIEKYSLLKHCNDFNLTEDIMRQYQPRAFDKHKAFDVYCYDHILNDHGIENFIKED